MIKPDVPVVGSLWRHIASGATFTVTALYNLGANRPGFPVRVAYAGQSLRPWCEDLSAFRAQMEPASSSQVHP